MSDTPLFDVVAIGESLIDFTPCGLSDTGMQLFARNPGGAPVNVLAMVSKLGGRAAFIGKVGADGFGEFLKSTIESAGIDSSGLRMDSEVNTTLAFVQLDEKGDRSFSFYRKPGADLCLSSDEVDERLLRACRIFHFGSVSLTDEPSRTATLRAVEQAKASGAIVSYDPNYRPLLWNDEARAKKEMLDALQLADIVKVSEEEMRLLTGSADLAAGAEGLGRFGAALVLVTLGPKGVFYRTDRFSGTVPTYDVETVDTTGAGDAFWGALLNSLRGLTLAQIRDFSKDRLEAAMAFCNAAGSLATTKKGAIPALPSLQEIKACLSGRPLLR